jgi:Zn-finger nucleic acid-binding protein
MLGRCRGRWLQRGLLEGLLEGVMRIVVGLFEQEKLVVGLMSAGEGVRWRHQIGR